ncbi:LacI family DNA-binding transcriptional regulator [Paraburkholderia dipogonis]|uniref:LacI family DNA-binding transcriptional regulator n=1 Tax=Paraburkholderia dipogonis TaxID=1211383 RepID=A0A4Y8MHD0_9BURK|nr:LacI family DNA-binding transcriptional regulator [Paraburkholderia dipogonis]TFE36841.1 LacI family DNA-binding transcriptional regulator [Paraburkholderia dipogonis]
MTESKYRKTSIIDVAKAANVSESTVDRVLNGRGGVSREKEARVLEFARKLKIDRALGAVSARWLRIAIVMHRPDAPYYVHVKEGFELAQKAFEEQRIICAVTFFDGFGPPEIAKTLLRATQKADALVVIAYEHPEIVAAVRQISRTIPVIALATDLPGTGRLAYVGADNRAAGRVAGELMGRFIGEAGGQILIITGLHELLGHAERESGFRSVLERQFPTCEVVETLESRERPEVTERLVRDAFRRNPAIGGVYNTSVGSEGIADGLRALHKARKTIFVGHEFNANSRGLLLDGILHAVIDENPFNEATRCVELILRHYHRNPSQSAYKPLPVAVMLRENLPPID